MFHRDILKELEKWAKSKKKKPLVIRGARQVGKTTVINQFATRFEQYIYLNLEVPTDRKPFEDFTDIDTLLQATFFLKNKTLEKRDATLIFIDEIQSVPAAINLLRYFYEHYPSLSVIAAGSMLENLFDKSISFPVGRVEFKVLRPVSFSEFLLAIGETAAHEQLNKIPLPAFAQSKLQNLFHTYALLGGMPEVVNHYATHRDLTAVTKLYDSLLASYIDDSEKYARNETQMQILRHAIRASFYEAGKRIKFQGFGNSNYKSKEVSESLRALQKVLLVNLIYPVTGFQLPLIPDLKKAPRLHVLDTGLMNYMVGIQKEIIGTEDLNSIYQGIMIEHLVGQELLAQQYQALSTLHFWVREKKQSSAEVDYIIPFENELIPIEVKSGSAGSMRSLHQYMDETTHSKSLRFYNGELNLSKVKTPNGKEFFLLNLPYFLACKSEAYLEWMSK
ncbi:MAG TPA: AAA family ATPase [Cyclobacteriaceae bacterium]|nr:MAG: ATPase AAA [Bacteroidetes bacterium OLB12]HNR74453.1 AAA family ATPase [Cyclobacteriaceae bacterium]HNT49910.1 AAA family ATPase [Cyclobacteriaceae bacterium]